MKVLDSGHKYELLALDGDLKQTLTFVKRCISIDHRDAERYLKNDAVIRFCRTLIEESK